ncbi:MAG TPA: PD-(D/E)XK nuclease family protein [Polyangiaceae bacterium]|nr:PD-(D/E)XK nuclease family protein [Polyangiaceae bacterium]
MLRPLTPVELVLLPSERHAEYFEHEETPERRVLGLRSLAQRICEAAEPELRETAAETTRLLARKALPGHSAALGLAVDDALGQLRRAGTQPGDLARVNSARAGLLRSALEDTSARLNEYRLRDHRESAWLAARVLPQVSIPDLADVSRVRVRGLSQWENGDLALLEALHQKLRATVGGGVVIEFPTVPKYLGGPLHQAVEQLAGSLEHRWAEALDPPELSFVEARADAAAPQVIEAAHEASEARAVARAVLDSLARGTALDRIAIVPVDAAEAFLEPLRAELTAAKLPFSEAWSRPTSAAPEAYAALELLRLAQGPLLRDALVDVLRVPDLELRALLGDSELAPASDSAKTSSPPLTAFIEVIARLPVRVDRSGRELLAALDRERRRCAPTRERLLTTNHQAELVLTALLARFERLREPSTRRVFRERARELFAELGLLTASRRGLTQAIAYAEALDHAPLAALGQNARAGRAIDLALERVVSAAELAKLGDERLPLSEFYEEFATALSSVGPNQGAGRAGTLRIAGPAAVAGLDWDLLIVCRAASSTLDWQSATSDSVLDADLLEQLPPARRPRTAAERAAFTRLALASALSRARNSLVTWAKRDARGKSGASRLVMNLDANATQVEPASPLDPKASRVLALAVPSADVRARATLELRRQDFYANPDAALDFDNGLAGPLERWVGGEADRPIALTVLERYARCAFLGFSGLVLRANQDDIIGDGLSARERGNLIHDALAVALNGTRASFGTRDLPELEREAFERADEFLRARISSNLRGAALRAALEDVAALLRWSFANSDGIWFAEAERAFGIGEAWSALAVGDYFVSGRIDRIDSNSDGQSVRVIDYKTGSVRLTGEHGEQLLQPWIYARKVAEEYRSARVSSGYLSLQRRKPEWKAAVEDSEPLAQIIEDKLVRTEQLIALLRAGRVPARPLLPSSCTRCDARDICRRPLSAPHEASE